MSRETGLECSKKLIVECAGGNTTFINSQIFFLFFQVMIDDDEYTAMPEKFPKFERDDEEKKFVFRIPKFSKNVLVDPSVNVGKVKVEKVHVGDKNAASWLQFNVAVAVFLQVAAILTTQ